MVVVAIEIVLVDEMRDGGLEETGCYANELFEKVSVFFDGAAEDSATLLEKEMSSFGVESPNGFGNEGGIDEEEVEGVLQIRRKLLGLVKVVEDEALLGFEFGVELK